MGRYGRGAHDEQIERTTSSPCLHPTNSFVHKTPAYKPDFETRHVSQPLTPALNKAPNLTERYGASFGTISRYKPDCPDWRTTRRIRFTNSTVWRSVKRTFGVGLSSKIADLRSRFEIRKIKDSFQKKFVRGAVR